MRIGPVSVTETQFKSSSPRGTRGEKRNPIIANRMNAPAPRIVRAVTVTGRKESGGDRTHHYNCNIVRPSAFERLRQKLLSNFLGARGLPEHRSDSLVIHMLGQTISAEHDAVPWLEINQPDNRSHLTSANRTRECSCRLRLRGLFLSPCSDVHHILAECLIAR